eukprot:CAMPEP_0118907624 /NCGR_PEP_ID=MMETSP1166-20130328/10993_1 /TAXON_ID=1104430 /ORGANISM="Chrysoreinhardia sp, Strain CCMP3193" /LENGTH=32 /DNA_ID= /DNA_START= /DNA_END= /DNA_ORIENTATION=
MGFDKLRAYDEHMAGKRHALSAERGARAVAAL